MAILEAYLDDFGKISVRVSRVYYNGRIDGFYLTSPQGYYKDCLVRGLEEHRDSVHYDLTTPADFTFGVPYTLHESHGRMTPLVVRFIVRTKQFDKMFDYDGDDLGSIYHPLYTSFALWAPTAVSAAVRLRSGNHVSIHPMTRMEKGVYRCKVPGEWKHATYVYLVECNGRIRESLDPYGLSSNANGSESAVIDTSEVLSIPDPGCAEPLAAETDAVLYECSVRDMTSSNQTGTSTHGRFLSLTEPRTGWKGNPTGLDYLSELGVTHIQLQPVTDFATVDENHPDRSYNWGYDPMQFMAPEGSYSSNPENPYARMKELRRLVAALHQHGLRVNLDVVFNHMFDVDRSSYDSCVPYYYFRYNDSGYLSNGSYCGNDTDSLRPMVRRLFLHSVRTLMELYGVDGFRFDLMGILDIDTMKEIVRTARGIKKDAMIYGEGWDMPTAIPQEKKAIIANQEQLPVVGYFNDYFRDIVKGKTSDDQKFDRGYVTGNLEMAYDMCSALCGNAAGAPYYKRFDSPCKSINALETHDNATLWDKMHACCADEPREVRIKRQKMMIACTILAQGVPFLHAGEEFGGTKKDNSNSYNAGDEINGMNWDRAALNRSIVEYTRRCIALRRQYSGFRLRSDREVEAEVRFSAIEGNVLFYDIGHLDKAAGVSAIRVIINPSRQAREVHLEEGWTEVFNEEGEAVGQQEQDIPVPECSVIVCVRK